MGGTLRAGAAVLTSVLMAGTAIAAPAAKCAKPVEVSAIQTAAIQQELMVAALTCNEIDHFNAFQTGFNKELRASDATLEAMFHRLFGTSKGEAQYHAFKTRLANDSSMRSIHDNVDYCQQARQVFTAALVAERPALADFVATVPVTEDSPVDSCEIRVKGSLSNISTASVSPSPSAAPSDSGGVIVPKPNPLRTAMQDAPAASVSAAATPPENSAAAPTQTSDKPAEKKDSGGFLSGLFGN